MNNHINIFQSDVIRPNRIKSNLKFKSYTCFTPAHPRLQPPNKKLIRDFILFSLWHCLYSSYFDSIIWADQLKLHNKKCVNDRARGYERKNEKFWEKFVWAKRQLNDIRATKRTSNEIETNIIKQYMYLSPRQWQKV